MYVCMYIDMCMYISSSRLLCCALALLVVVYVCVVGEGPTWGRGRVRFGLRVKVQGYGLRGSDRVKG